MAAIKITEYLLGLLYSYGFTKFRYGINYVTNTTNLVHTSLSLHFIDVQCLDIFRAFLARPQEALTDAELVAVVCCC
jgi:hypothetical protein